jgi:hypothetical protein
MLAVHVDFQPPGHPTCSSCGHSPGLHNAEGCIAARCQCWLTDIQVREQPVYVELQGEAAPAR